MMKTLCAILLLLAGSGTATRAGGLVWPTETSGIIVKTFGPPIETVKAPDGFTVTPADVSAMFAPRAFMIMIYADDTCYFVTRYIRKQTLKQAQLFGVRISGKSGAVEKQGLGLKSRQAYVPPKPANVDSLKPLEVTIGGKMVPLLFEGPELTDAEKHIICLDLEYLLNTVPKPVFLKLKTESDDPTPLKVDGFEHAVSHVLKLEDSQRQWFPSILKQRLGAAIEIEGRYHLLVHSRVTEAYKEMLSRNQPWEDMIKKLDVFMTNLLTPAKRKAIANDPRKARDLFFFYRMDPWDDDGEYRKLLLDDKAIGCSRMRRPSLLECKTMDKLLYVQDATIAQIPACFVLTLVGEKQSYIERWPPLIYRDGNWRILMFPLP